MTTDPKRTLVSENAEVPVEEVGSDLVEDVSIDGMCGVY